MPELDDQDDIILPSSIWGEIYYIKCALYEIYKYPQMKKQKWTELRRQIMFFFRWMKNK